jgi:acyl carrier protein
MDSSQIRNTAVSILGTIAPEIDPQQIDATRPLREQVDLDSMDWLNFLVALHQQLKVEIPESDYARLVTLDDVVDYLSARIGAR